MTRLQDIREEDRGSGPLESCLEFVLLVMLLIVEFLELLVVTYN